MLRVLELCSWWIGAYLSLLKATVPTLTALLTTSNEGLSMPVAILMAGVMLTSHASHHGSTAWIGGRDVDDAEGSSAVAGGLGHF